MPDIILQRSKLVKSVKQLLFRTDDNFECLALEIFRFQAINNPLYSEYIQKLDINPLSVDSLSKIPYLPISFFKTHYVQTGKWSPVHVFESSGTTGSITSRHRIRDLKLYEDISLGIFSSVYGDPKKYHILGLLPSYLERDNSSLVYMVKKLLEQSESEYSGFYLNNKEELVNTIDHCKEAKDRKILLIGVSFALLDLAEQFDVNLNGHIVMETGGMKGRRKELIREELHAILQKRFDTEIHSEYGMTELLSQAYSQGLGKFQSGKTMRILLRDISDPFNVSSEIKSGGINIIDLANIDTCSFIETQDIGAENQGFIEIKGRFDNSDVRGCNLMIG